MLRISAFVNPKEILSINDLGYPIGCEVLDANAVFTGTLERWDTGTLEHWNTGTGNAGTLGHWDAGTLGRWNTGTLGHWDAGTLVRQSDNGAWDIWTMG